MENKMKESFLKKNKKELILAGIVLLVVIGISYAWLTYRITNTETNVIVGGNLQLTINNEDPIVKVGTATYDSVNGYYTYDYAVPLSDAEGKSGTPYSFTITNNGDVPVTYSLYLDRVSSYTGANNQTVNVTEHLRLADSVVKYSLMSSTGTISSAYSSAGPVNTVNSANPLVIQTAGQSGTFTTVTIQPNTSINYELRLWISSTATNSDVYSDHYGNKAYVAKLRVEAQQYYDQSRVGYFVANY